MTVPTKNLSYQYNNLTKCQLIANNNNDLSFGMFFAIIYIEYASLTR